MTEASKRLRAWMLGLLAGTALGGCQEAERGYAQERDAGMHVQSPWSSPFRDAPPVRDPSCD